MRNAEKDGVRMRKTDDGRRLRTLINAEKEEEKLIYTEKM
jgi:hypothetical protein